MPTSNFPDYAQAIENIVHDLVTTGEAGVTSLKIDQRSSSKGYIVGVLQFLNGSELHFKEFVNTTLSNPKLMYAYHYQTVDKVLIFRQQSPMWVGFSEYRLGKGGVLVKSTSKSSQFHKIRG